MCATSYAGQAREERPGRRGHAVLADALGFSPVGVLGGLPPGSLGPLTLGQLEDVIRGLTAAVSHMKQQASEGEG